jgi:two-component system chemotaxis response regulator CheY
MGFRVLVVDDSAVMRSMIVKTLRVSGLPVEATLEAGNGREALEVLEREPVDLALVDLNMPVMGGEELIDRLRLNPGTATLNVVVVSSDHTDARMQRLRRRGVPIVHKPFNPAELRDAIVAATGVTHAEPVDSGAF